MYNRYIPQHDGSYCRKTVPERPKEPPCPAPVEKPQAPPCSPSPPAVPLPCPSPQPRRRPPVPRQEPSLSIGSFMKQLLPKDFATEDLLIVLLLLLMAGDCPEEQNTALLTLALYLFL